MDLNSQQIGKGLQWFGWLFVLFNGVKYGYGVYDTLSDPSVSAYAPLIVAEGMLFACSGLFIVWLGRRIVRKAERQQATDKPV
ncbi:MAG: hypothetical protein AB1899_04850 [Pseudomonadota bacterium]